jgi:excinuclease ABC subunit B
MLMKLVDIQYRRNDISFERSKFRVRGDCVEVWPSYEEYAFRIELWGTPSSSFPSSTPSVARRW